ncbi:hypothetical protein PTKIN_Ptkin06aG0081100 [Pterospermum kingtungense]
MSEASDQLIDLRTTMQNWSHDHPLVSSTRNIANEKVDCSICEEPIEGGSIYYGCTESDCKFYLHRICADLPLTIDHPFYHRHALNLQKKPPNVLNYFFCDVCWDQSEIFYNCSTCDYAVDVKCALLPQFIAGDFSKIHHSSHAHPLIFTTKKKGIVKIHPCVACQESTPGPIYSCANIDCEFYIHKKCAELPPTVAHPSHRKHPLLLLTNAPPHQDMCSCHLCTNHINGFIYHCSLCQFDLQIKHIFSSGIEIGSHEHPFYRVSKPMSFICDACGTGEDCIPYLCISCNLAVHKDCISLPKVVKISRHLHPISHSYFLLEKSCQRKRDCRICYDEVKVEYGSYYCSDCSYIVHVNCAMDLDWLEVVVEDQTQKETLRLVLGESNTSAEDVTATEIKHFSHQHNLQTSEEMMKSDGYCNGCMGAISGPFYFCKHCDFFVHKSCAKLPMKTRYWVVPWLLVLFPYGVFKCNP